MLTVFLSCGKKSSSDSDNTVSTTPAVTADPNQENVSSNSNFSASADKSDYDLDELIMVEIQNLSTNTIYHADLSFSAETDELLISKINCFEDLNYHDKCSFVLRFKNPRSGYHKIKVSYQGSQLQLTIRLKDGTPPSTVDFLYQNYHTYSDCYKAFKYEKNGFIKDNAGESFCSFRGPQWDSDEKIELLEDPLDILKEPGSNADEYYCPKNWTVNSFEFAQAIVVEHTNFWGGRKDVVIPAGQSKEICVKRNLFGCKERKTFFSRLVKVNCY